MLFRIRIYCRNAPSLSYGYSVKWVHQCFVQSDEWAQPAHRFVLFCQLRTPSRSQSVIERLLVQGITFNPLVRYSQMVHQVIYDGLPSDMGSGLYNNAGARNVGNYRHFDARWSVPYARTDDGGVLFQRCQIYAMLSTYDINLNYDLAVLRNRDNLNLIFLPAATSSQFNEYWNTASSTREVALLKRRLSDCVIVPVSGYNYPTFKGEWAHIPHLLTTKRVGVKG